MCAIKDITFLYFIFINMIPQDLKCYYNIIFYFINIFHLIYYVFFLFLEKFVVISYGR